MTPACTSPGRAPPCGTPSGCGDGKRGACDRALNSTSRGRRGRDANDQPERATRGEASGGRGRASPITPRSLPQRTTAPAESAPSRRRGSAVVDPGRHAVTALVRSRSTRRELTRRGGPSRASFTTPALEVVELERHLDRPAGRDVGADRVLEDRRAAHRVRPRRAAKVIRPRPSAPAIGPFMIDEPSTSVSSAPSSGTSAGLHLRRRRTRTRAQNATGSPQRLPRLEVVRVER